MPVDVAALKPVAAASIPLSRGSSPTTMRLSYRGTKIGPQFSVEVILTQMKSGALAPAAVLCNEIRSCLR